MAQQDSTPRKPQAARPLWDEVSGVADWQTFLAIVAEIATEAEREAVGDALRVHTDPLQALLDPRTWMKLEDAIVAAKTEFFSLGAQAGYALGKTWPAGIDEFEDWPARARASMRLDDGTGSDR